MATPDDALRQLLDSSTGSPEEREFAYLVLRRGVVTEKEIREAVVERARLRSAGQDLSLGQILMRRRSLSPGDFSSLWGEARRISGSDEPEAPADRGGVGGASEPPDPDFVPPVPAEDDGLFELDDVAIEGAGIEETGRSDPAPPAPADDAEGHRFGDFHILGEIARGGMGVVYRARDATGRIVALKVTLAGREASEKTQARFHREARATASLSHPNVVKIHQFGSIEGYDYFTMEFIDGRPFDDVLTSDDPGLRERLGLVRDTLRGLHAAHEVGVIHRDLKPQNILVDREGTPKLTDFGLAKVADAEGLTKTGVVMGTPFYMAPEQASGQTKYLDRRSDVFSMGTILYETVTDVLPFQGDTPLELYREIIEEEAEPPSSHNPAVPPTVERIILKALEKEPEDRYRTAAAMADDIDGFLAGQDVDVASRSRLSKTIRRIRRDWPRWVAGAVIVLLVASGGVAGLLWWRDHRARSAQETAERRVADRHGRAEDGLETARDALGDRDVSRALVAAREGLEEVAALREDPVEGTVPDPDALRATVRSLGLDEVAGGLHRTLGAAHRRLGNADAAVEAYRRAADLLPAESRSIRLELARAMIELGDPGRALEVVEADLAGPPDDRSHLLRGEALLALDRPREALEAFEAAEESGAAAGQVLLRRARARWEAGEQRAARSDLEWASGLGIRPKLLLADLLREDGRPREGLDVLVEAARSAGRVPALRLATGRFQLGLGRADLAADDLRVARAGDPDAADAPWYLARASLTTGDRETLERARSAYERVAGEEAPVVRVRLGRLAYLAGDLARARERLDEVCALAPRLPSARRARARLALREGRPDAAASDARAALEADPASRAARRLLGLALLAAGEPARAREELTPLVLGDDGPLEGIVRRDPTAVVTWARAVHGSDDPPAETRPAELARRARARLEDPANGPPGADFLQAGLVEAGLVEAGAPGADEDRTMDLLEMASRASPALARADHRRADLLRSRGETEAALAALDRAARRDPHRPATFRARGSLHLAEGRTEAARADAARAFELAPTPARRDLLVRCLLESGEPAEAADLVRALDPSSIWDGALARAATRALEATGDERAPAFAARAEALSPENRRERARELTDRGTSFSHLSSPERVPLLRRALRWNPDSGRALRNLARSYEGQWRAEEYFLLMGRVLADRSWWILHADAGIAPRVREVVDFDDLWSTVRNRSLEDPSERGGRALFAWIRVREGDDEHPTDLLPGAVGDVEAALRWRPEAAIFHALRAALIARWGYPDPARATARRATELEPESGGIWLVRAQAHAVLGDREAAVEALDRFLDLAADMGGLNARDEDVDVMLRKPIFDGIRDHPTLRDHR